MRLLIVRHGETIENFTGITQGHNHGTLSSLGELQAKQLANYLIHEDIDIVYSSDLGRCKDTIALYLKKSGKKAHYDRRIREQGKGFLEGGKRQDTKKWYQDHPGQIPEGGESLNEFEKRVISFLKELLEKEGEKNVLLMTHGGVKSFILAYLLHETEDYLAEHKKSANVSITEVVLYKGSDDMPKLHSLKDLDISEEIK